MASGQGNVEEALAALLALKPVIHDGVGNETTLTYGITSQTRAVPALPGSAELDRMRQSLEIMKHNVSETVRQLQLNMDTIGAFLRAQNALLPAQPPLPQRQGSQDGILKIKLVNHQAGDKKGPTPSNRPTPPFVETRATPRYRSNSITRTA